MTRSCQEVIDFSVTIFRYLYDNLINYTNRCALELHHTFAYRKSCRARGRNNNRLKFRVSSLVPLGINVFLSNKRDTTAVPCNLYCLG